MGEIVLSLNNITVDYGRERILDHVSLDVRAGEVLGIRGRNGAGKTTLIGVMAGTVKPDSGTRTEAEGLSGSVCYVPQDIALYPSLTGRQNLEFWAEAYGLFGKRRKARMDYLLDLMSLKEKANKRVETYSGGMKRRLNMAAALVITPKLLLLDEPTVGADVRSVRTMQRIILDTAAIGTGVVLISHQAGEIEQLCDRILTLTDGRFAEKLAFRPGTDHAV